MENATQVVEQEPRLQQVREKVTAIRSMQHGTERENAFRALHADLDRIEKYLATPVSSPDPDIITLVGGKFLRGESSITGDINIVDDEGNMMSLMVEDGIITGGPRYSEERKDLTMNLVGPSAEQIAEKEAAMVAGLNKKTMDRAITEAQQGVGMVGSAGLAAAAQVYEGEAVGPIPIQGGQKLEIGEDGNLHAVISGNIARATSEGEIPPQPIQDGTYTGSSAVDLQNGMNQANAGQAVDQSR